MNQARRIEREKKRKAEKKNARKSASRLRISPEQAYYIGHCEQLAIVIGFLRANWNFGAKRLQRFTEEFNEFAEDMNNAGITGNDIGEVIKDETGWDMFEAFPGKKG